MTGLSPRTALEVQALKALGEEKANGRILDTLRSRLTQEERDRALREARYATPWVYEIIKRMMTEGNEAHA